MEKNAKIVPFFYKEQKRMQRWFRSFIKNGKECKDRSVHLKRMDAQPCQSLTFSGSVGSIVQYLTFSSSVCSIYGVF